MGNRRSFPRKIPTIRVELGGNFGKFFGWVDRTRKLFVRANADTPEDAETARLGAEGIGLAALSTCSLHQTVSMSCAV